MITNWSDIKSGSNSAAMQVAGILRTSDIIEAELISANKLSPESMAAFKAHFDAMKRMDGGSKKHIVIVAVNDAQHQAVVARQMQEAGFKAEDVDFVRSDNLSRESIIGIINANVGTKVSDRSKKVIRGIVSVNDPMTEAFSQIVDSLIVSDASFKAVTLVYIDHIARQKDKYATIFTEHAINKLKDEAKKSLKKAQSSGMSVEAVRSEEAEDQIDEALEASFESDVAF